MPGPTSRDQVRLKEIGCLADTSIRYCRCSGRIAIRLIKQLYCTLNKTIFPIAYTTF